MNSLSVAKHFLSVTFVETFAVFQLIADRASLYYDAKVEAQNGATISVEVADISMIIIII